MMPRGVSLYLHKGGYSLWATNYFIVLCCSWTASTIPTLPSLQLCPTGNPAQPATPLLWYSLNNDHLYCSVLFLPNKCKSTKVKASSEAIETGSYALTLPGVRNDRTETFTILSRAL